MVSWPSRSSMVTTKVSFGGKWPGLHADSGNPREVQHLGGAVVVLHDRTHRGCGHGTGEGNRLTDGHGRTPWIEVAAVFRPGHQQTTETAGFRSGRSHLYRGPAELLWSGECAASPTTGSARALRGGNRGRLRACGGGGQRARVVPPASGPRRGPSRIATFLVVASVEARAWAGRSAG